MLHKIDHIGIAVKDLDQARHLFCDVFGLDPAGEETVETYEARLASLKIGETEIELLQGLSPTSPISRFIAKKGEGIQHICFGVDDIESALRKLKQEGVELIDQEPRTVRDGRKVAFLRPQGTHGVLIELVERAQ